MKAAAEPQARRQRSIRHFAKELFSLGRSAGKRCSSKFQDIDEKYVGRKSAKVANHSSPLRSPTFVLRPVLSRISCLSTLHINQPIHTT